MLKNRSSFLPRLVGNDDIICNPVNHVERLSASSALFWHVCLYIQAMVLVANPYRREVFFPHERVCQTSSLPFKSFLFFMLILSERIFRREKFGSDP